MHTLYRLLFFAQPEEGAVVDWTPRFPFLSPIVALFAIAAGAVLLGWFARQVYMRMEPDYVGTGRKRLLVGLRTFAGALMLLMLTGVYVERSRTHRSEGTLAVLFDRSASMGIAERRVETNDVRDAAVWLGLDPAALGAGDRARMDATPRLDLALAALRRDNADLLRKLAARFDLRLYAFGEATEAQPLAADLESPLPLATVGTPDQNATRLGDALRDLARRLRGQHVAAVVVLTDGGHNSGEDPVAALPGLHAPLYPIGVGLARTRDVDLPFMMMERVFFKGDLFPLTLRLRHEGYAGREAEFVVRRNGIPIRTEKFTFPAEPEFTHTMDLEADTAGTFTFETEVTPFPDEVTARNNARRRYDVRIVEKPLRVLVVEDRPRWEWRHLKTALAADSKRVNAFHLMTSADRRVSRQRPDMVSRFPEGADELRPYGVVVLGDVPPTVFTRREQALIEEHVRVDGCWLILVAGPRHMPASYAGTLLADLAPVEMEGALTVASVSPARAAIEGFRPVLTAAGRADPLLRLDVDPPASERLWSEIPPVFWFYAARGIKPGAETLMEIPVGDRRVPLVVRQRYGTGHVLYVGTDETWRWRKLPGGEYHRRLWSQIVTQSGLDHVLAEQGKGRVQIETESREVFLGAEVTVLATILGADGGPLDAPAATAVVAGEDGREETVTLEARIGRKGVFSGVWTPTAMGKRRLYVRDLENEGEWELNVAAARVEFDRPVLREDLLKTLAETSGGRYLPLSRLSELPGILDGVPPLLRAQRQELTLWNAPGLVVLLALALAAEWILRKQWDLL